MSVGAVVCDAGPLIALTQVGRVELLRHLFPVVLVPPAVVREAVSVATRPAWIEEREPGRPFDARLSAASLGAGETEVIALALEIGISSSSVLLDDLKARKLALRLGLEVNGTVGVLLAAKRHGLLAAVRPEIEALLDVGLHLAPDLVEVALADVGEGT